MRNNFIFLIVGESGSGKTTIVNHLEKIFNFTSVSSYTTRLKRNENETGHIFVTDEKFSKLKNLIAYTKFAGYKYGATAQQIEDNQLYIIDTKGIEYLKEKYKGNKNIYPIYISVDEDLRKERITHRENRRIAITRIENDKNMFNDIDDYSMVKFDNNGDLETTIKNISKYINYIININNRDRITNNTYEDIIYISHPYLGLKDNEEKVAHIITNLQKQYPTYLFLSPIHTFSYDYNASSYEIGIAKCFWLLEQANKMWVFGNWINSKGCKMEIDYCKRNRIPFEIKE